MFSFCQVDNINPLKQGCQNYFHIILKKLDCCCINESVDFIGLYTQITLSAFNLYPLKEYVPLL